MIYVKWINFNFNFTVSVYTRIGTDIRPIVNVLLSFRPQVTVKPVGSSFVLDTSSP